MDITNLIPEIIIDKASNVDFADSLNASWQKEAATSAATKVLFGSPIDDSPNIRVENDDGSYIEWEVDRPGIGGASGFGNYISSTATANNAGKSFDNIAINIETKQDLKQAKVDYVISSPPVNKILLRFTTNMTPRQEVFRYNDTSKSELLYWQRGDTMFRNERLILTDAGTADDIAYYDTPQLISDVGGVKTYEVEVYIEPDILGGLVYPITIDPTVTTISSTTTWDDNQPRGTGRCAYNGTNYFLGGLTTGGTLTFFESSDKSTWNATASHPFSAGFKYIQVVVFSDGIFGVFAMNSSTYNIEFATYTASTDTWGSVVNGTCGISDDQRHLNSCVDEDDQAYLLVGLTTYYTGLRLIQLNSARTTLTDKGAAAESDYKRRPAAVIADGNDKLWIFYMRQTNPFNFLYVQSYTISTNTFSSGTKIGTFQDSGASSNWDQFSAGIDSNGKLHVAYRIPGTSTIRYLNNVSGSWVYKLNLQGEGFVGNPCLTVLNDDTLLISDNGENAPTGKIVDYDPSDDSYSTSTPFGTTYNIEIPQQVIGDSQKGESFWAIGPDYNAAVLKFLEDDSYSLVGGNGYFNNVLRQSLRQTLRQTIS